MKVRSDIEAERTELSQAKWEQTVVGVDRKQRICWLEAHIAELMAAGVDLEKVENEQCQPNTKP